MIYTEMVTLILGISLVLYMLLGGADFGAGVIELLIGDKGNISISKAIAPVWEANHMWLIIGIVILFNGFPVVYSVFSTALHIPVLLFLVGIIFRGAAFTFRHYDAFHDYSQTLYTGIFRYSSLFTVFFLGLALGALISGSIPAEPEGTFVSYYILPWINGFCISLGIFMIILSAYIAAIFLLGEAETAHFIKQIQKLAVKLLAGAIISGLSIFFFSFYLELSFHTRFLNHPVAIVCGICATVLAPFILRAIHRKSIWSLRIICGAQIFFIVAGMFIVQWPALMLFSNGTSYTIYNASAPELTMKILFIALCVGVCIIFPALYYLFRVFKTR